MTDRKRAIPYIRVGVVLICMIAPFLFMSCATHIATRATQVRLIPAIRAQEVENTCEFLGNVTGSDFPKGGCLGWTDVWERIAYNNSLNELMKNADEIGATHLFVNLGSYYDLRGEAFVCTYCMGADGEPDLAYCLDENGNPDIAYCLDADSNPVGVARCEGNTAKDNQTDCVDCGGEWVPAINQQECESLKNKWVPRAEDRETCQLLEGTWLPIAKDQVTCEETKGGKWVLNQDLLREKELDVE